MTMIRRLAQRIFPSQTVASRADLPRPPHRETLDRLLSRRQAGDTPRQLFAETSDDFWLWCLTEGYREDERLRSIMPGFPPPEVQLQFAGASGDDTMRDAFNIYCLVKSLASQYLPRPMRSVMEFGSGWGRIIRCFSRDMDRQNLQGIDCMPAAIDICKTTNPYAQFRLVDPFPPTTLANDSFDVVYAYSVFSHLSEEAHMRWLEEFKRLLRPGGLLIATTRPREFVLACQKAREEGEQRFWAQGLVVAFRDTSDALARFDRGEFLYEAIGGGGVLDASFFGEACIPRQYVVANWPRFLEFVDYLDDRALCQQNVIVARKR
jgi:SAM-dependent methyltransferase